jgi:hypothetical protein
MVYSPIVLEQNSDTSFQESTLGEPMKTERTIELTCSAGHSDVYQLREIKVAESKPPGKLHLRRAMAAGG